MTRGGKPGAKRGRVLALIIVLAAFAVYIVTVRMLAMTM